MRFSNVESEAFADFVCTVQITSIEGSGPANIFVARDRGQEASHGWTESLFLEDLHTNLDKKSILSTDLTQSSCKSLAKVVFVRVLRERLRSRTETCRELEILSKDIAHIFAKMVVQRSCSGFSTGT